MRFLMDPRFEQELLARTDHTPDCYVRSGEYLHHLYLGGVKYVVAPALYKCLKQAHAVGDKEAEAHLRMHQDQLEPLIEQARQGGWLDRAMMLGDPPPQDPPPEEVPQQPELQFIPAVPQSLEETGLNRTVAIELILRTVYNFGRPTGQELARDLRLAYKVIDPVLKEMRKAELLEVAGQRGVGDSNYEYVLKNPRGQNAVRDALNKTEYSGPAPVPFQDYLKSITSQSVKSVRVTRRNIRKAFEDLIITDAVFNEIGPAVNSGTSIFFFGFPGNGKTSIAERITRLMGDDIFVPHAIEVEGQVIKVYDSVVHTPHEVEGGPPYDQRWVRIKRPVIVVGGELVMEALDLRFSEVGRFYEAPLQMKANGGIFMIDDFGRQTMRPQDLLNRWIVPLEKRYDYLTTITGKKLEIPFELLLIFSTNLDPLQLADEAFLRRIKFKIEIRDPDERQWREIWGLVCRKKGIEPDPKGLDYVLGKWIHPQQRPLRMCQPRDILEQMASIATYNMERLSFNPDLIDAACETYFVSNIQKDFGAAVKT